MRKRVANWVNCHPFRTSLSMFAGQAVIGGGLYSIFEKGNWWDGIYWSQVVMTTVGFGDFSPETLPGRWVFFFTVFVGILATLIFTGAVAASITSARMDGAHDETEHLHDDVDHAIVQAEEVLDCLRVLRVRVQEQDEKVAKYASSNGASAGLPVGAEPSS